MSFFPSGLRDPHLVAASAAMEKAVDTVGSGA
jgi:hypothetical protein